jgi:hypothetical protein
MNRGNNMPGKTIKRAIAFVMIAATVFSISAVDYQVGNYRLSISDQSGRFSLFYEMDGQEIPLFFSENPRTSSASLRYNDILLRLSDEKPIIISIQEFTNAVVVQYSVEGLRFEQSFSFIQDSSGEILALAIDLIIINQSAEAVDSELRLIFDTTLGEQQSAHFVTARNPAVNREYGFSPNSGESWILSRSSEASLLFTLAGSGASAPREVVAANWKRLSEAPWGYEVQESRNFNLLPFSINDSALGLYYGPDAIPPQDKAQYRLYLSFLDSGDTVSSLNNRISTGSVATIISEAQQPLEIVVETTETSRESENQTESYTPEQLQRIAPYLQDLETIDVLIQQIDTLLRSRSTLSREELEALQDILDTIRENIPD